MVKVLIVDDSLFMCKALNHILSADKDIEVIGMAHNGKEALEKLKTLDPDVITLDVEMPRMDGLAALQEIMKTKPTPTIMISSLTEQGAETTLKALEAGALDFLPKSQSTQEMFGPDLTRKIKVLARRKSLMQLRFSMKKTDGARPSSASSTTTGAATARSSSLASTRTGNTSTSSTPCKGARDIIGIGVSTGGPPAVQKLLAALPENFPATILIAQHMPAAFTGPFAKRLDNTCKIAVSEAINGERPKQGHAYIAPGGKHLRLRMKGPLPELVITEEPTEALYKPSATELMHSIASCMPRRSIGLILTGMGSDGLEGIRALKEKGGYIMAQNEASCVVYGMPKAIVDANLSDNTLELDAIANALITAVKG